MAGKYKTYTPEFREEVAKMVIETSRAIADVAREYGVNETMVGNWVRAYPREARGGRGAAEPSGARAAPRT